MPQARQQGYREAQPAAPASMQPRDGRDSGRHPTHRPQPVQGTRRTLDEPREDTPAIGTFSSNYLMQFKSQNRPFGLTSREQGGYRQIGTLSTLHDRHLLCSTPTGTESNMYSTVDTTTPHEIHVRLGCLSMICGYQRRAIWLHRHLSGHEASKNIHRPTAKRTASQT